MTEFSFDANILIDALAGFEAARTEIRTATSGRQAWISRIVWIEVLSKGSAPTLQGAIDFMAGFGMDELDQPIAERAAELRRERSRFKLADSVILATAQLRGRTLVTRNTKDFPAGMPGIRVPYTI